MATQRLTPTYTITGARIGIRPWNRRRDRQQIDRWPPYSPALPEHWLASPAPAHGECVSYAVDLLSAPTADRLVGRISVRQFTLGVVLHPDHLGAGLGTEALRLFVDASRSAGMVLLRLYVAAENIRAHRCYQRCGFVNVLATWNNGHRYWLMERGL
jgi:RimJ/RimL family protein N-acetyltransferase